MPRPLVYQQRPWQIFEITTRCLQSRFLLRPGPASNRRIIGVIARALELQPDTARLYFAGGTSNHLHLIGAFADPEAKARFKQHIKTNISKELGLLHDWPGALWERRTRDIAILDDAALEDRLMYLAAHGVKDGLSLCPDDWPGIPWVRAVTHGQRLGGVWYDRTALYHRRRAWRTRDPADRGRRPVLHDVAETKTLTLTPPPMWAHLDADSLQTRWRALVADALERYPAAERPLGARAVLDADPQHRPTKTKRSAAPCVHTRQPSLRRAWQASYGAFVETYRSAMRALREGVVAPCFPPEGCRPVCFFAGGG